MPLMYFTEQPMSAYPADEGRKRGATALMFSNRHFDPVAGSRLYNEYLEHYRLAEEMGFDGIMLNEHHNAPFCMQAKCNVFASILAAVTKRVKIVLLGNPLPLADNPVRLAEDGDALAGFLAVGRGHHQVGAVEEQVAAERPVEPEAVARRRRQRAPGWCRRSSRPPHRASRRNAARSGCAAGAVRSAGRGERAPGR